MARCEDFPCCGHELGCCPNYDEGGQQLDMVCTCGKRLPINNRYSICDRCLRTDDDDDDFGRDYQREDEREEFDDRYCPESERDNEESAEEADARWHDEMDLDMFSEEE